MKCDFFTKNLRALMALSTLGSAFALGGCVAAVDGSDEGMDDGASEPVDSVDEAVTSGSTYNFKLSLLTNSCLDVAAAGTADGTNVQEWSCNGTPAQVWRTDPGSQSGYWKLVNPNSNKCLDVNGNGTADGTNIQLWSCNGNAAQDFQIVASNGYNRLVGRGSGKCVDVSNSGTADGTNVQLWTCNNSGAQTWNAVAATGGGGTCTYTTWACGPDAGCAGGPTYHTGDIVRYAANGQYYQALHDNGGLDPTVSTWYWSPTTCTGGGGGGGGGGTGIAGVVSEAQFNAWFPSRNAFYSYAGLTSINQKYPDFANSADITLRKREAAAFLANMAHETGDLIYIVEQNTANYCSYCDPGQPYGCPAGQCSYYGRGPIQLSWNFNYKAAGDALGYDLLNNPSLVQNNASVAWQTGGWYWNTQAASSPANSHNAMLQSSGAYGFGFTIRAINGGLECPSVGGSNTAARDSRINKYKSFCDQLGVSYGNNLSC